ncbi:MAG: hypothetical protein ACRC6T_01040 [Sarcina sp.]
MHKLEGLKIDAILDDILGDMGSDTDILDMLLSEKGEDVKISIEIDLMSLEEIFYDEAYYNFLIVELRKQNDIKDYVNKYYIGMEILLSIAYYKLYDGLEHVITTYMKALDYKVNINDEIVNAGKLDELVAIMRCDYTDKRAIIDRASKAFDVDKKQRYTKKINDINNKLIQIQKAQMNDEECENEVDITPTDFTKILEIIDEVVFRIQNAFKVNWKFIVKELENN